jgi:diguanylate cyclase (GGDEF)-like protein
MSYAPVFYGGARQGNASNRPDGLVFGAFEIAVAVETIIAEKIRMSGVDVYIFDPSGEEGSRLIYWKSGATPPRPAPTEHSLRALPHWEDTVSIIDQTWGVIILPADVSGIIPLTWHAIMPLPVGLLLTAMVVAYLVVSRRHTEQLETLNASLRESTENLQVTSQKISYLARHDPLTGLPNRRVFFEELQKAVSRALRGRGATSVLLVDLDNFKSVNDIHGHTVGDIVLCEVAKRLSAALRASDTAARLGGDEFAIIAWHENAVEEAAKLANRIITALSQPIEGETVTIKIGCSIGISLCPANASEPARLLHTADVAMYRAKREGSGNYRYFNESMEAEKDALVPDPGADG